MAVTNVFYTDAVIRRQVFIERLKSGQRKEFDKVLLAVSAALRKELSRLDVEKVSDLTKKELQELIRNVLRTYDIENKKFSDKLLSWLQEYSRDEAMHQNKLLNRVIVDAEVEEQDAGFIWSVVKNTGIAAVGLSIAEQIIKFGAEQRAVLSNRIKIGYVQAWTLPQLRTDIIGTKARAFRDGLLARMQRAAGVMVGTVIQHSASVSQMKVFDSFTDWVVGYEWVSVLDSKTSAVCRSLDGRQFAQGEGPLPPIHPNCRSTILALFREDTSFLSGLTRKASSGSIEAGTTYYSWLKTQSTKFQDEVLGKTRGLLFRKGGLSADEFAKLNLSRTFEPLTLKELRQKNPEIFERANIKLK